MNVTEQQGRSNIAENLRILMQDRDLSQRGLAEKSGVSQVNISRILQAKHTPSAVSLFNLAAALRTSTDFLLRNPEENLLPA